LRLALLPRPPGSCERAVTAGRSARRIRSRCPGLSSALVPAASAKTTDLCRCGLHET